MSRGDAPNTARIIDYWLGGSHHLPIDVEAAQHLEATHGKLPALNYRVLRGFIQRATRYVEARGVQRFLVFASGLPTCGNVHEVVSERARVLYTDIDPTNVSFGRDILSGHPRARYCYCDATDISSLDPAEMLNALGSDGDPLGMVFVGLSALLDDQTLGRSLDSLYDWVPTGSHLILDFDGEGLAQHPALLRLAQGVIHSAEQTFELRDPARIRDLIRRWTPTEQGLCPVGQWRASLREPPSYEPASVFMYGCVARKTTSYME